MTQEKQVPTGNTDE